VLPGGAGGLMAESTLAPIPSTNLITLLVLRPTWFTVGMASRTSSLHSEAGRLGLRV